VIEIKDADTTATSAETESAKSSVGNTTNNNNEIKWKETKLFYDENVNTFFRRPCWSPDGNLVFLPCGVYSVPGIQFIICFLFAIRCFFFFFFLLFFLIDSLFSLFWFCREQRYN
jgi:hypothetical protein